MNEIRPSPIAGLWYPSDPQQLTKEIHQYLNLAKVRAIQGNILALMVPHAGYRYSGKTAAYAFQYLVNKPIETVYLFSPYHDYHPAEFLSTAHAAYQTPLGTVQIHQEKMQTINQALKEKTGLSIQQVSKDREHSLEIQLPFLQTILKTDFQIVPIMVRSRNPQLCHQLGEIIAQGFSAQNSILIASTDLSHFYPEITANQLDQVILDAVKKMQPENIFTAEENGSGFACGAGALATTIWASELSGANQSEILYHTTSAETTHDPQSVVGYGAAVFYQSL